MRLYARLLDFVGQIELEGRHRPMIEFRCHGCGKKLRAGDELAGSVAVCPKCKRRVAIPVLSEPPASEPVETPAATGPAIATPAVIEVETARPAVLTGELIPARRNAWREWSPWQPRGPLLFVRRRRLIVPGVVVLLILTVAGAAIAIGLSRSRVGAIAPPIPRVAAVEELPSVEDVKREGLRLAEEKCRAALKAPKTAEFSSTPDLIWTRGGFGGTLRVISYVDAQNVFGVPLRSSWEALVEWDGPEKGWKVFYVNLGKDCVYADPSLTELAATFEMQRLRDAEKRTYRPLQRIVTDASRSTETFSVEGPWRVRWMDLGGARHLQISVRNPDGSEKLQIKSDGDMPGQKIILEGGDYYLRISPRGFWKIQIEEAERSEK